MLFKEKEKEDVYEYEVEDVFGVIEITSKNKLEGELLDDIVHAILKETGSVVSDVSGGIKTPKGTIEFEFDARDTWEDDDEDLSCKNTPTSTVEQVKEFILTNLKIIPGISWLVKFVEAFREAWRKM